MREVRKLAVLILSVLFILLGGINLKESQDLLMVANFSLLSFFAPILFASIIGIGIHLAVKYLKKELKS